MKELARVTSKYRILNAPNVSGFALIKIIIKIKIKPKPPEKLESVQFITNVKKAGFAIAESVRL